MCLDNMMKLKEGRGTYTRTQGHERDRDNPNEDPSSI